MSATAIIVLLVYLAGVALALRGEPFFALLSYFWIFYNDPQTSWWGRELPDFRYSLLAAVVALLVTLGMERKSDRPWLSNTGPVLLLLYVIWVWVQAPWAVNPAVHLDGAILGTKLAVLCYVIYRNALDTQRLEWLLWAHVAGCFIFGWKAYTTVANGRLETVGGPGVDDSNILATHLVTGAVAAGMLFISKRGWSRWLALGTLPFMLDAIIRTQSRGGFISLAAAGIAVWYLTSRKHRLFVTLAGAMGVALFLSLATQDFWDRMSSIKPVDGTQQNETRVAILGPQFRMFLDHPLGAGHRGNEFLSPQYMSKELLSNNGRRAAHNTFMAALVDQGVPGAVLLLGLYGWAFLLIRRLKKMDRLGLPDNLAVMRTVIGAALASLFVSGMFLNLLRLETQVWFLALLAAAAVVSSKSLEGATGVPAEQAPVRIPRRTGRKPTPTPAGPGA